MQGVRRVLREAVQAASLTDAWRGGEAPPSCASTSDVNPAQRERIARRKDGTTSTKERSKQEGFRRNDASRSPNQANKNCRNQPSDCACRWKDDETPTVSVVMAEHEHQRPHDEQGEWREYYTRPINDGGPIAARGDFTKENVEGYRVAQKSPYP